LKKIFNYFSIFTIVLGTTFGSLNSANAADFSVLDAADLADDAAATTVLTDGTAIDMDETGTLTVTVANGAETDTSLGAITVSAGNPTLTIQNLAADTDDEAIAISSVAFDVAGEGDITITTQNNAANDGDLAVTIGDLSTLGTLALDGNDAGGNLSTLTVNLTGTTAVTEASTAVGAAKNAINLNISGASTTFTNGYDMDDVTGTVTLTMSGSAAQTFTGAVTVADDGDSKIDITNTAGTTFASAVGAVGGDRVGEVDINANAIASFSNTVATDLLSIVGSLTLTENNNDALDFDMGAASKLIIGKTVVATETLLTDVEADADIAAGAKLYAPINLANGTAIILLDGNDGNGDDATVIAALNTAAVDSILMDYTVTADGANDQADLNATYKSVATTESEASVTNNQAIALKQAYLAVIDDADADSDAENAFEAALLNSVGTFGTEEDTKLTRQVAPQDDIISGSTFATKAMTGSLQGIMSNRMAALRSGDAYYGSGMSAGSLSKNSGFLQVFGTDTEQKNKTVGSGTQFGYDASSAGIALGLDGITDGGTVIGLSLSTSDIDVEGKGTGNSINDITSYTTSIYMDKSSENGYFEGSLTLGMNENSTSRKVNAGGLDRTYKGEYDSYQASLSLSGGVPNDTGNGFVTPFGGVTATNIVTERYRETSSVANDNLRLTVDQDDVTSIVGTLGVKYHNVLDNGGVPMISLAINNEFGDDTINSTNAYQVGGTAFTTSTAVEELSATLGLGYSITSDNTSVELAYEADANDDDYLSHYGSIKIVGRF